jgi:hypothetical protein
MQKPNDFLLNTDFELDKVILFKQGDFTSSIDIPHNLDFIPLVFGVWSTDEDFSSVNPIGAEDSSSEPGYVPVLSVGCYANASIVKLTAIGNTNNTKIYYRVYGFEPDGARKNVPYTSKNASRFIVNTDYNYLKLFKTGVFTQDNEQFTHDLGYIPQTMAWYESSAFGGETRIAPIQSYSDFTGFGTKITNSKIIAGGLFGLLIDKIYWRIYYDEAK